MNEIQFDFEVPAAHPSLAGHFPGNPIVPGVLLLDHVMARLAAVTGRAMVRVQRVKFSSILKPGEAVRTHCVVEDERASFRVAVSRDSTWVLVAEGVGVVAAGARG
ncbi:hypothetical protein [Ramlibacter sp. PS4R-6]|uniref:hypothetical protein n=1 Tax=Ramlibacter sp. PS4R-6 TaxID=3133438 RepID=UPI00309E1693